MPELDTPAEVREFLRLCLRTRTINELATVMPDWLAQAISNNDPRLASLRQGITEAEAALADARARYVTVLDAWIEGAVEGPLVCPEHGTACEADDQIALYGEARAHRKAADPAQDEPTSTVPEWCGQCDASGARFVYGGVNGRQLLRACPKCHPDPEGFSKRVRERRAHIAALMQFPDTAKTTNGEAR